MIRKSILIILLLYLAACQPEKPLTTATPTPNPTITPTNTPAPVPTLTLDEKKTAVAELYETNGNCEFPCWWGIIPGETDWQTVELFLDTIDSSSSVLAKESEADQNFVVVAYFSVPKELSEIEILEQGYRIDNGKVMIIHPEMPIKLPKTTISEILRNYGQPSDVWIDTYGYSMGEIVPFRLVLFYPEQGILVRYFDDADFQNNNVIGCFGGHYKGAVVLWDSNLNLPFAEALNGINALGTYGDQYYKPLEETTEMDVEAFYQTFLNSDTEVCIKTPDDLWMDR